MSLPTNFFTALKQITKKFTGRKYSLFIRSKPIAANPPSYRPKHLVSNNGAEATPFYDPGEFIVDDDTAVAEVATLVFNAVPAAGKKYKFGDITLTTIANGATPANSYEIAVGTTAATTNTAFKTKLHALTAGGAYLDATNTSDGPVTLTANTAGVPFDFFSDDTASVYTFAITTANVSDKGYALEQIVHDCGLDAIAETRTAFEFTLAIINESGARPTDVEIAYITQVSDIVADDPAATMKNIAAGVNGVLGAVLNNTDVSLVHGEIYGLAKDQTTLHLQTAMQNLFGSSASVAFRIFSRRYLGDSVRLALGTAGPASVSIASIVRVTPAGRLPLVAGKPNQSGWKAFGQGGNVKVTDEVQFIAFKSADVLTELQEPGPSKGAFTFDLLGQRDLDLQELISGNTLAKGGTFRQLFLGSQVASNISAGKSLAMIYEDDNGAYGVIWVYSANFAKLDIAADPGAVNAITIACVPIPDPSREVDQVGQICDNISGGTC